MRAEALSAEVFSINFLRKEIVPPWVRRGLAYALVGYVGLQALLLVWLTVGSVVFFFQSHRLQARQQKQILSSTALANLRQEMQNLQEQASQDLAQFNSALALQRQRFLVGGKLDALAKTVPTRTWITQLSGSRAGRSIDVRAAYLVDPKSPYSVPTKKWMEALRADLHFKSGLKGLDLGSTSRKSQTDAETFLFNLSAEWSK